mmetsp:Transcript_28253/g.45760  ORF Transcript_28253/g.45760 Transcript_28253/m.45760 type:complete len:351 (-) Transcript_28253:353-1405(-)|eukprot:CAMPEP_0184655834 /NCGR_PEP_ID=MMETSP0308-20130426/14574_1 /TAXON_ID=38269 /ORGANISM="Gloeochaete witrockiana, Strain SAG 46.84" /LENGTH=350 /DNA_ID=CAMNT_0027092611 /DNA_START=138 /DNA_END=1190 /DNA_ORIENTATION=+
MKIAKDGVARKKQIACIAICISLAGALLYAAYTSYSVQKLSIDDEIQITTYADTRQDTRLAETNLPPFQDHLSPAETLPAHAVAAVQFPENDSIVEGLEAFQQFCLDPISESACVRPRSIKPFEGTYGEWTACWDNPPSAGGLVYSIGVGGNWDFDKTLANDGLEVHSFDCTVQLNKHQLVPGMSFEKTCLGGYTGEFTMKRGGVLKQFPIASLCDLVNRNSHYGRFMHILKVDCEGCEWKMFERFFQGCPGLLGSNIGQILIEMHFAKTTMVSNVDEFKRMLRVFASFKAHGFVPFMRRITWGGETNRELIPELKEALRMGPNARTFMGFEMGMINTAPRQVPRSYDAS